MKKIVFLLFLLIGASSLKSQTASTKEIVFVNEFKSSSKLEDRINTAIRNSVMEGLIDAKRLIVKDIKSDAQFQSELSKRSADASVSEEEYGFGILRNLDARWVVGGTITRVEAVRKTHSNGDVYYDAAIDVSLNIVDVATGTIAETKTVTTTGGALLGGFTEGSSIGNTEEDAIASSCKILKARSKTFAEENFTLKGNILEVASEKKGKAEEVYIDLGDSQGVKKGDIFEVFEQRVVAGRKSRKKIGEVKVKAVEGDDISLCNVTKEGKVILEKMQALGENETLVIESRPRTTNILF